ncbi:MAG: RNA polymerase sigma factor [Planctomycetota bacterium]|jgi:RNA polymerase sigma factor (sigma-70 family)
MDTGQSGDTSAEHDQTSGPDDGFLVASMLGGDSAALSKLMERYDRLVRYTIFRVARGLCERDPDWLESVASDTWAGFVQSMRREAGDRPQSVKAYLAQIARNRAVSALRQSGSATKRDAGGPEVFSLDGGSREGGPHSGPYSAGEKISEIPSTLEEPIETVARIEMIEALRGCLEELDADGRAMASQLSAITERRWQDAASALGIKESTLRSRWKQVLGRLATCVRRKTGGDFAPLGRNRD